MAVTMFHISIYKSVIIRMFAAKPVLGLVLLAVASCISITVSSEKERCMIVTSNNAEHFLKVDLKFDGFEAQTKEEGYRVVLLNTETFEEQAFQVYQGTFRKEFQLTESDPSPIQMSSTVSASRSC